MGGCKCTFRSCTVNSQKFPKMSFFHYPLTKGDRIDKWIEYADFHEIHKFSPSQAKNKAVCGLHFKDQCFMNYKKNRLTPTAIPTLHRLLYGKVLDYSLSPNPKPTVLQPTTDQHLLPPPGTLIWGNLPEFWDNFSTLSNKSSAIKFDQPPDPKKPRILNRDLASFTLSKADFDIDEKTTDSINVDEIVTIDDEQSISETEEITYVQESNEQETQHYSSEALKNETHHSSSEALNIISIEDVEYVSEDLNTSVEEPVSKVVLQGLCSAYENEIAVLKKALETKANEAERTIAQLEVDLATVKNDLKVSEAKVSDSAAKLKDCEEALAEAEAKSKELVIAAATESLLREVPKPSPNPIPAALTKAQLFNGIKKYLSASMVALVRMEMFGNTERAWKTDEKQVSVELLRLGENVYKYFRDEWRFRVPPLKMVEKWTNEVVEEEEDDL